MNKLIKGLGVSMGLILLLALLATTALAASGRSQGQPAGSADKPNAAANVSATDNGSGAGATGQGSQGEAGGDGPETVTLCHATGSPSEPYELITVSASARDAHMGHGDIEPTNGSCPAGTSAGGDDEGVGGQGEGDEAGEGEGEGEHVPVDLCHATASETNPYELITVDDDGAFHGHMGSGHQDGEDIIPPFEYEGVQRSQNWDAEGQAIFANGCELPIAAGGVAGEGTSGGTGDDRDSGTAGVAASGGETAESGVAGVSAEGGSGGGVLGMGAKLARAKLPFTGFPLWLAALLGAGAVAAGWVLWRRGGRVTPIMTK